MGATSDDITPSCDGATRASELPIPAMASDEGIGAANTLVVFAAIV